MAANITVLPSAKVPLIYDGTTIMSTEWYRFFYNIYGYTVNSNVPGAIPTTKGGTGQIIYTDGQLLIGNSTTGSLNKTTLTAGTAIGITNGAGSISIANTGVTSLIAGTGISVSSATGAVTVSNTGISTFSAGTTGFTPNTPTGGAITLAGTLNVANGGTGQTSYTNGQLLIGNTTGNTLTKATLTAGTNVTITNGAGTITIAATNSGGTVTSVSVVSANGFAGTVATATSTPAITLTTSITGILKGNATAILAATSGTDYAPGTSANTSGLVYSTTTTGALTTATGAQVATALGSTNISGSAANVTGIVLGANGGTGVANTGSTITIGGNLTFTGAYTTAFTVSANTAVTLPTSGTLSTLAGTETFTNKTITARVSSTASISSPLADNSDNFDLYAATAQAGALTISADAGTPTDGRKIQFRFTCDATPRVITFTGGVSKGFKPVGVTLTASGSDFTYTLTASKTTYFGAIYSTASSRWEIVALSQEV